jgi:hypothetical protein
VPQRNTDQAIAEFNIRILHLRCLPRALDFEPQLPIPHYSVDDYDGDIEEIAGLVRRAWKVPSGPIANLTGIAESAGIFVFHVDLEDADVDGVTISAPDLPPCVFLNKFMPDVAGNFPATKTSEKNARTALTRLAGVSWTTTGGEDALHCPLLGNCWVSWRRSGGSAPRTLDRPERVRRRSLPCVAPAPFTDGGRGAETFPGA